MKKIIAAVALVILLSSCNSGTNVFIETTLPDAFSKRVEANIKIIDELENSGLLASGDAGKLREDMQAQAEAIKGAKANKSMQKSILSSVVAWRFPQWVCTEIDYDIDEKGNHINHKFYNDANFEKKDIDKWNDQFITEPGNTSTIESQIGKINYLHGQDPVPISLISDSYGTMLNLRFSGPVYVLKTSSELGIADGDTKGLDEVMSAVKQFVDNPNSNTQAVINSYFTQVDTNNTGMTVAEIKELTNSEAEAIPMYKLAEYANQIITTSIGSKYTTTGWNSDYTERNEREANKVVKDMYKPKGETFSQEETTCSCGAHTSPSKAGNYVYKGDETCSSSFKLTDEGATESYINKPGRDLVISQEDDYDVMAIRLKEFNQDAFEKLRSKLGVNSNQYFWYDGKIYLMEYPVQYVSEMVGGTGSYSCNFKNSDLGINLRTRKILKYQRGTKIGTEVSDVDPYLSVDGAKNGNVESQSSFCVYGNLLDSDRVVVSDYGVPVSTGRIVLRDYLESTYMPNVVGNDKLVVYGRKLRILNFEGASTEVVARFYGKDGKKLSESTDLYIDAFGDAYKSMGVDELGNEVVPQIDFIPKSTASNIDEVTGKKREDIDREKLSNLPQKTVTQIMPTMEFPGVYIGSYDMSTFDTKPLFYAMFVRMNPFDTGLFSGWINKTDATENSLAWWTAWLADHNYKYRLNTVATISAYTNTYEYELSSSGLIGLDLETIGKIQVEYDKENKSEAAKFTRTAFVIVGVLLIIYAVLLLIAWVIDTSFDFGYDWLGKLSFGSLEAVTSTDEFYNSGESRYITFGGILFKAFLVSALGCTLILVDIAMVIAALFEMFGRIATYIYKLFN